MNKALSITVLDESGNIINKYEYVKRKSDSKAGFWDYRNRNFIEITKDETKTDKTKTDEVLVDLPEDYVEVPCLESNTELAIKHDHREVIRTK